MKARKKPVVVECFRFGTEAWPQWFLDAQENGDVLVRQWAEDGDCDIYCEIATKEGLMRGNPGDVIIQGAEGELYPCDPGIFNKTYEVLEGEKL